MKNLRLLLVATLVCLFGSFTQATTVIPPTFDELVGQAEVIFEGTVTDVTSQWVGEGGQRHIVSYVTFRVDDSIKGDAGASYTLRMLGGTVGDYTMGVTDAPVFARGERDILFVEKNGSQFIPLVGIMHGRFAIKRDAQTGRETVATDHGTLCHLDELGRHDGAHRQPDNGAPLSAADFKSAIRSKLAFLQ